MRAVDVRESRSAEQVAGPALAWIRAHRDEFALGEDALAVDGQVNASWKPLGELAQVCATVTRTASPTDPLRAAADDLLTFAWEQTGRGELFLRLQRLEPFATYPLEVYAALASAGLRYEPYEAATAVVARTRGWRLTEQEPTRRLGVLNAELRSGIPAHGRWSRALERTWLGGLPEPWTFERATGYAVTHVVFHLTDWGRADGGLPPEVESYLADWLPAWLDTCVEARMWDLSCELLAVAATLSRLPAAAAQTWPPVAAAQLPGGAVPEEGGHDSDDFAHCYHSTLMAVFAAALTLRHSGRAQQEVLR
ncbi:DUF6895 family protein [Streptomyces sp. NPDC052023]|uniref:DUF6895 family protein n=1 Tax=Streptomyces sp. NPDC052023 TaxID=3365681 RepID=UPI0037D1D2BF